jgi:hypothetical protein
MWIPTFKFAQSERLGSVNSEWIVSVTIIDVPDHSNRPTGRWVVAAVMDTVPDTQPYRISSGYYSSREIALEALDDMIGKWDK